MCCLVVGLFFFSEPQPPFLLSATVDVKRNIFDLCTDTKDCYLAVIEVRPAPQRRSLLALLGHPADGLFLLPVQNQDTVSLDTVCRLYEVGRQKLAEEGDDDDQVRPEPEVSGRRESPKAVRRSHWWMFCSFRMMKTRMMIPQTQMTTTTTTTMKIWTRTSS